MEMMHSRIWTTTALQVASNYSEGVHECQINTIHSAGFKVQFCMLIHEDNWSLSLVNAGGHGQYLLCSLCGARLQPQWWSKCDNEEMHQVLVFVLLSHRNQNATKDIWGIRKHFKAFRISKHFEAVSSSKALDGFLLSKFWRLEGLELSWDHQTSSQERHPWDLRLKSKVAIPAIPTSERPQLPPLPRPLPAWQLYHQHCQPARLPERTSASGSSPMQQRHRS